MTFSSEEGNIYIDQVDVEAEVAVEPTWFGGGATVSIEIGELTVSAVLTRKQLKKLRKELKAILEEENR